MEADKGGGAAGAPVFEIGLALAGAISAGAYTAGALDFLFQALAAWEAARGTPGVPTHRVVLKVMAGASAGAVTGALGAVALARGLNPQPFSPEDIEARCHDLYPAHQQVRCVFPSLYETWVTLPDMLATDGRKGLLGTDNVRSGEGGVRSLLNAAVLDDIKRAALEPREGQPVPLTPAPFIANPLHLYMTVSNMRGIPFRIAFGRGAYGMQTIADRVHYAITGLGNAETPTAGWLARDAEKASLSIDIATLPAGCGGELGDWDRYGTAALASAAFPIGLAARELTFGWEHYLHRRYPIDLPPDVDIQPGLPSGTTTLSTHFTFQSVDGGLVNNDPFDYAQYALTGGPSRGPVSGQAVRQAIIMVAPFPEPPAFPPEGSPSAALVSILRALFPALVNQARFRASELAPAVSERDFSRFLIVPLRRLPRTDPQAQQPPLQRFAIACGLLGGFGGFLGEAFRAHDFQLGRRNCQQFLRTSFLVPADNIVAGCPGATGHVPVIPLVGDAEPVVPLPRWPTISGHRFRSLCRAVAWRIDAVVPSLIAGQTTSVKLRLILRQGWKWFLLGRTLAVVRRSMLADLVRRGQIEGWDIPRPVLAAVRPQWDALFPAAEGRQCLDDARAVLAELVDPAFDLRTPQGIAHSARLPEPFVAAMLVALADPRTPEAVRAWREPVGYTLYVLRPGWLDRRTLVRAVNRWWNAPTIG